MPSRAVANAFLVLAFVSFSGCGVSVSVSTETEAVFDSTAAKEALFTALDAWKQGKAGALSKRKPPIRFSDDDLRAGFKLLEYRLANPDEPIQRAKSFSVVLKVSRGNASPVERPALYQVSLTPQLAVSRADP